VVKAGSRVKTKQPHLLLKGYFALGMHGMCNAADPFLKGVKAREEMLF
jgi:hypothetical protein